MALFARHAGPATMLARPVSFAVFIRRAGFGMVFRPPRLPMPKIPVLFPARISSESGYHRFVLRIRVKDMTLRPVRNDSLRNVRRGLAREHLRSQCEHNSYNKTSNSVTRSQYRTHGFWRS